MQATLTGFVRLDGCSFCHCINDFEIITNAGELRVWNTMERIF